MVKPTTIALLSFCLAAPGCAIEGETCGRGRCHEPSRCISVFTNRTPDENRGGPDEMGWVDNEWWCLHDECPTELGCGSSACFEDPADDGRFSCVGSSAELELQFVGASSYFYPSGGGTCLCQNGDVQTATIEGFGPQLVAGEVYTLGTVFPGIEVPNAFSAVVPGEPTSSCRSQSVHSPGRPLIVGSQLPADYAIRVYYGFTSASCP